MIQRRMAQNKVFARERVEEGEREGRNEIWPRIRCVRVPGTGTVTKERGRVERGGREGATVCCQRISKVECVRVWVCVHVCVCMHGLKFCSL
jgi:hypothetical protein